MLIMIWKHAIVTMSCKRTCKKQVVEIITGTLGYLKHHKELQVYLGLVPLLLWSMLRGECDLKGFQSTWLL